MQTFSILRPPGFHRVCLSKHRPTRCKPLSPYLGNNLARICAPWIFARVDPKTWGGGAQNSIGARTAIPLLAGISCAFERPPFRFRFEGSSSSGPIGIKTKQLRIQWQQRVAISWHSLACAPPGGCLYVVPAKLLKKCSPKSARRLRWRGDSKSVPRVLAKRLEKCSQRAAHL